MLKLMLGRDSEVEIDHDLCLNLRSTLGSVVPLAMFLYRYGIFWMPPGESSHPGDSEYVWQRGVEGVLG